MIGKYVAKLRHLATHCQFGDFLNDETLLSKKNLTLLEVAQSAAVAESHSHKLCIGETTQTVFRMDHKQKNHQVQVCYRCGGSDHIASMCTFPEVICNKCKKRGHIARACRSEQMVKDKRQQQNPSMNKLHKPVCNVEVDNREAQQQHNDEGSEFEADFRGSMFRVGITRLQMPLLQWLR